MLTGITWCIPLKTKTAAEVVMAYKNHIVCTFGGSVKILMDNGTEFKNELFKKVKELGTEMTIHSPLYRPQSNGKIELFHRFLKACIAKHINHGLEWDELAPMATACYNYFPNCNARESALFLMFGRDPVNKLNHMLKKTTLTDEVADDYIQLCNEGRFTKKCVPRGYIPDLDWTTIHDDQNQPIKPVKQGENPTETTVTPAAPTEVEGSPSSHLKSKTKQQSTTIKQKHLEHNPPSWDPQEHNPAKVEVNNMQVDTGDKNTLVHMALTLLRVTKAISDQF